MRCAPKNETERFGACALIDPHPGEGGSLELSTTRCPSCKSSRVWKDGVRETTEGSVQRFICRVCGRRFSEGSEPLQKPFYGSLNTSSAIPLARQICVSEREMKNLARVETRKKRAAGATETSWQHVKGELINLAFWMMKQGYAESTIKGTIKPLKTMIKRGLILNDPESAKEVIARQNWKNGTKSVAVEAYSRYLAMNGLTWDKPRYKPDQKLPFISTEEEIDQLIASCGLKASVFLQGLKETGADPGELANIQWTDINKQTNTITINNPVKGHNPRILQISNDLIARLELLPKHPDRVFNTARAMYSNYYPQRNRAAEKFSNPRLKKITFITLRHWKGTMEYHKTKDILHVKKILGHKNIQNTMVYINLEAALFTTRNDDFTVKVADTLEEACKLVEVGFEYVTDMDGAKIFRKRK